MRREWILPANSRDPLETSKVRGLRLFKLLPLSSYSDADSV
jgi:hypothetical protein